MPTDKVQRKTERSHEENQERAYIAASRRADRSIEARVQSARMASDIHKKRTGKGFRITEEIVVKEEMYEEEEDEFPRSYRLLGPHMQTASTEMNLKVEAFLTNRVAMSALVARTNDEWRLNEINRLFDQSFPNAGKTMQQLSQTYSPQPTPGEAMPQSPEPSQPTFSPVNYDQGHGQHDQRRASSYTSPAGLSQDAPTSPPGLTPGSVATESTSSRHFSAPNINTASLGPAPFNPAESVFTTELPAEAKMFLGGPGLDMNSDFTQNLYGQSWMDQNPYPDFLGSTPGKAGDVSAEYGLYNDDIGHEKAELYAEDPSQPKWDGSSRPPGAMDWNAFLNENMWTTDNP